MTFADPTADLPSCAQLYEAPQLGALALLQAALRVVPAQIDLHDSNVRPLRDLLLDSPDNLPAALLGQLIIDRCAELSELVTAYRTALHRPLPACPDDDFDIPF